MPEDTLKYGHLDIGPARYMFMLKANARGRFLRITENTGDAFGGLIVPDSGLVAFQQVLEKMFLAARQLPPAQDTTVRNLLETEFLQVERKRFCFELEDGPRGRFLRLIENSGTHGNEVIVLIGGLEAFKNLMAEMVKAADEQPPGLAPRPAAPPWTPMGEDIIKEGQMLLENKSFIFQLKENTRGRFLRIIEAKETRLNTILIPGESLEEFKKWVVDLAKAAKKKKK